jgi:hypothetical protein
MIVTNLELKRKEINKSRNERLPLYIFYTGLRGTQILMASVGKGSTVQING